MYVTNLHHYFIYSSFTILNVSYQFGRFNKYNMSFQNASMEAGRDLSLQLDFTFLALLDKAGIRTCPLHHRHHLNILSYFPS